MPLAEQQNRIANRWDTAREMSQENEELVRRAYELVRQGDIAGLLNLIGPGFELHENVLAPEAGVYYGEEGLRKWQGATLEAFIDFRFEPERFIERGDWVFVPVHASGRGRGSGAPFTARYVTAFKFRSGHAVFVASYENLAVALEAAGLSE
jgi:ketosteroid isomerase-like protein